MCGRQNSTRGISKPGGLPYALGSLTCMQSLRSKMEFSALQFYFLEVYKLPVRERSSRTRNRTRNAYTVLPPHMSLEKRLVPNAPTLLALPTTSLSLDGTPRSFVGLL